MAWGYLMRVGPRRPTTPIARPGRPNGARTSDTSCILSGWFSPSMKTWIRAAHGQLSLGCRRQQDGQEVDVQPGPLLEETLLQGVVLDHDRRRVERAVAEHEDEAR